MFKKLDLKTLLSIFGVLFALVALIQVAKRTGGDRNFKNILIEVDTAKVNAIVLKPKNGAEIRINRSGSQWSFTDNGATYTPANGIVQNMLAAFVNLKADHVVGTSADDYIKTGCADTSAMLVKIEEGGKVKAQFLLGGFAFQYPESFISYVRLPNEVEVYAIKDLSPEVFKKRASDLRDKTLTSIYKQDITKITFTYPDDSSFSLIRDKFKWKLNAGWADSIKMANYLNQICHLSGAYFADEKLVSSSPTFTIVLEGKNFSTIVLKAESTQDETCKWIVTSSANPKGRFNGNSYKLTEQIFVGSKFFTAKGKIAKKR